MKIRLGFVSNSSSSSFLIYGTNQLEGWLTEEELEESYEEGLEDILTNKLEKENVKFLSVFGLYDYSELNYFYLGQSPANCPDDMTMGEFKKQIEKEVEKVLGSGKKCGWCEESWYDG